jgi:hypothetical protein
MIDQDCRDYLENPDANATHLESCAQCRALFGQTSEDVAARGVSLEGLPLAPWEGAAHRAWPLVLLAAAAIIAIAIVLSIAAGIPPIRGAFSNMPSIEATTHALVLASEAVHNAPTGWHIAIGAAFVIVNSLLFLLLRRAPRGIDVSH